MIKWLKVYISGILSCILIFSGIATYATGEINKTIDVVLNSVNLKLDGQKVSTIGEGYTLSNGDVVPFTILYKGTTYLPVKKISDILGKEIGWNGDTRTVSLGEQPEEKMDNIQTEIVGNNRVVDTNLLQNFQIEVIKFGDEYYDFEFNDWNTTISSNNLYFDLDDHFAFKQFHSIVSGSFGLVSLSNPNIYGMAEILSDRYIDKEFLEEINLPYLQIDANGNKIKYGQDAIVYDGVKTYEYNIIKYLGTNGKALILTEASGDITIDNYNMVTSINGDHFIDFRKWCDYLGYDFEIYFDTNLNVYILEVFNEPKIDLTDFVSKNSLYDILNSFSTSLFFENGENEFTVYDYSSKKEIFKAPSTSFFNGREFISNETCDQLIIYLEENY